MLLFYLLVFFFGTFIGSFLNVLIDRPARGETVFWGSSHCEKCNHKLVWNDLIPLWSYISLGGHCRYCRSPIPFWLPVVEVTTGLLFVLATYIFGLTSSNLSMINMAIWLYGDMAISLLIVIFFSDLKYHLIYDQIVYTAIGITLLYRLFSFFTPEVPDITHYELRITSYFLSAVLSGVVRLWHLPFNEFESNGELTAAKVRLVEALTFPHPAERNTVVLLDGIFRARFVGQFKMRFDAVTDIAQHQ